MSGIEKIDGNFVIKSVDKEDLKLYDVRKEPFAIYGHYAPESEELFRRIPKAVAEAVSMGVSDLHTNTAGIRVRFKTNSPYVAIKAELANACLMPHMPASGSAGFDLYADGKYEKSFMPVIMYDEAGKAFLDADAIIEGCVDFSENKMRDIYINFPLYSNVKNLFVGISDKAELFCGNEYSVKAPVVYYGSSITQGGCASRPGNSYQAIISRQLDCNYINLGFSGNARGEDAIAEYISGLSMSVFVYDYDHNSPTPQHLRETHKPMFDKIRAKNPDLPIIMITRPNNSVPDEQEERREIIYNTYLTAKDAGDENVYFIDGAEILNYKDSEMMTCDGTHPNDFGFWCMSEVIGRVVKKALE